MVGPEDGEASVLGLNKVEGLEDSGQHRHGNDAVAS